MKDSMDKVRAFHEKHGFSVNEPLNYPSPAEKAILETVTSNLEDLNVFMRDHLDSLKLCRLHLIVEETAELTEALHTANRIKTLDALADLTYVVLGTAVAYGLPLDVAFNRVHASNMTKNVGGLHPKGKGYVPPSLEDL